MAKYRIKLPQLESDRIFLSDGGLMTEFFFSEETKDIQNPDPKTNIFLPMLKDDAFMEWLNRYYRKFMDLALKEHNQFGFIMMSFMTYKARKEVMQKNKNLNYKNQYQKKQ